MLWGLKHLQEFVVVEGDHSHWEYGFVGKLVCSRMLIMLPMYMGFCQGMTSP